MSKTCELLPKSESMAFMVIDLGAGYSSTFGVFDSSMIHSDVAVAACVSVSRPNQAAFFFSFVLSNLIEM